MGGLVIQAGLTALLEGDAAAAGRAAQAHVKNVRRAANRRIAEASALFDVGD